MLGYAARIATRFDAGFDTRAPSTALRDHLNLADRDARHCCHGGQAGHTDGYRRTSIADKAGVECSACVQLVRLTTIRASWSARSNDRRSAVDGAECRTGIESCCDPRRISDMLRSSALRCDPANRTLASAPSHIADQFEGRGPAYLRVGHGNTLDRGVLRAPQAAKRRSNDHRSFAEGPTTRSARRSVCDRSREDHGRARGVLPPGPIKLRPCRRCGRHAMNGNRSARRTYTKRIGAGCGWAVKGVHYD